MTGYRLLGHIEKPSLFKTLNSRGFPNVNEIFKLQFGITS